MRQNGFKERNDRLSDLLDALSDAVLAVERAQYANTGEREELVGARAAIVTFFSDTSPKWTRTDDKNPEDEQRVIGHYGAGDEEVETLVYHAADAPDGPEEWTDVWGELRDRPMFWMPVEALGRPK